MTPETPPDARDPWDRYGWIMAAVWLLFLIFPLVGTFTGDRSVEARIVATAAIGAFAGVYVWTFVRVGAAETPGEVGRIGGRALALLVGLTLTAGTVIQIEALGMTPFLVSVAMFVLPLRRALWVGGTCLVAAVAIPLAAGEPVAALAFGFITLAVGVATGTVRILDERTKQSRLHGEELALVSERERVARDVHDVLGHSLTAVSVKAQLAERLIDQDPERARAELVEIQALARQSLAEIRATVAGLRMARLDEELAAAATVLAGAGIAADLPAEPERVDPRHRPVIAWALREAVTNVVRHSGARRCTVSLEPQRLVVTDDGRGLPPSAEGNGLRGLRERVQAAGGTLSLDHPPGGGTRLEVRL